MDTIKDSSISIDEKQGWNCTSWCLLSPSLHVQVTDGHRRETMVTDEVMV